MRCQQNERPAQSARMARFAAAEFTVPKYLQVMVGPMKKRVVRAS
jgi:hypothetical protein